MRTIKFILLITSGILLLVGAIDVVLNISQVFSINLPTSMLFIISLAALSIYLLVVNSELKWRLSRKRQMQERIDKLASFRQEAITTLYALTPSITEFPAWVNRYKTWEENLVQYLKDNFPFAVYEMFEDLGTIPGELFSHIAKDPAISNLHLHYLQMLAKHLKILERIIENNTSLLPDARPGLSELLKWLPGD